MARFQIEQATVRYGTFPAVTGIDFNLDPGESVGIVGPSGAGKTTLLRLLNGAVRPSVGRVKVDDSYLDMLSIGGLRAVRARVGVIHQDLRLVPNLRAVQNVVSGQIGRRGFFASLRGVFFPGRADVARAHKILERVGIPEKLFERTDSLSGGQRQRVAIARALFQSPDALLADEPVSSVDPARARDTVALLTQISRERELSLCVSLHNLELAREFFPRLIGMRGGRIVFDKPTDELHNADFEKLYDLSRSEILND